MRWIKPSLRHSISALLGNEIRKHSPESLEPVRQAMLTLSLIHISEPTRPY